MSANETPAALGPEPDWWIVLTEMGYVIFHGRDKDRAERVATIHNRIPEPLFRAPPKPEGIVEALREADAAIAEYIRYLDGGEMRGSYDGKPERNALRKAGIATRKALAASNSGSGR
jgi:hypothetical protein